MIIELGIKCYNNFPGIPRYFEFMEMLVSNFSPGSAQYFYASDIAYEEGSITGETWTPWFYVDIEPSINNQIRISYADFKRAWYPKSLFPTSTGKLQSCISKHLAKP